MRLSPFSLGDVAQELARSLHEAVVGCCLVDGDPGADELGRLQMLPLEDSGHDQNLKVKKVVPNRLEDAKTIAIGHVQIEYQEAEGRLPEEGQCLLAGLGLGNRVTGGTELSNE